MTLPPYRYRAEARATLVNAGTAQVKVYVRVRISESDAFGTFDRGVLGPQEITLNPGEQRSILITGNLDLRPAFGHRGIFEVALDSAFANIIATAQATFTPLSPFDGKILISAIQQSETTFRVGVMNYSDTSKQVFVEAYLASNIAGSGKTITLTQPFKSLGVATTTISSGGSHTFSFTVSQTDLEQYKYFVAFLYEDHPTKYGSYAVRVCLDGKAIQITRTVVSGIIESVSATATQISVRVRNTGNVRHTFWVGCTIAEEGKVSGSGCEITVYGKYYDLKPTSITVDPNTSTVVTFTVPSLPAGRYQAVVKLWYGYDTNRNLMLAPCYDGKVTPTFAVSAQVSITSPQITVY